ncbi:MAG: class I SAM-dependent methyltransferase, partial [Sphingobacteriales bacterium]
FTLAQKKNLIIQRTGLPAGTLLDIGAGAGTFATHMRGAGWKVTGIEPDPATRESALKNYQIKLGPPEMLYELTPQSFNAITMWHVLEHVHDMNGYLSRIAQLMKPGAVAFIAVPNYTSDDATRYGEHWAAYDIPIHLYHFSPKSMKKLLAKHGFKLKTIKPMWFDSFYVSLLSEKYKTGKQHLLKGFWSGMISNLKATRNTSRCSSLIYIAEL